MHKAILTIILTAMVSCSTGSKTPQSAAQTSDDTAVTSAIAEHPAFSGDSAYRLVARQVAFGPRVPGTDGHKRCEEWIVTTLKTYGADTVSVSRSSVKAFDGTRLPIANIFAQYNPEAKRRILLVAHYDTRPWANEDPDESRRNQPIDGANDGGSGVAVMLEAARVLGQQSPTIGVDLLFTDAEDYGDSESTSEDSWCLGTQHWVSNLPYGSDNRPAFGILLDMVGGINARFPREYSSQRMVPAVVDRIWGIAAAGPHADRFPNSMGGAIVDDHIYINSAGIPCVDIIESANPQTGGFPPTWHTHADNIDNIDAATLGAVGSVVLDVIYSEPSK